MHCSWCRADTPIITATLSCRRPATAPVARMAAAAAVRAAAVRALGALSAVQTLAAAEALAAVADACLAAQPPSEDAAALAVQARAPGPGRCCGDAGHHG
jgi:hypothetical protein